MSSSGTCSRASWRSTSASTGSATTRGTTSRTSTGDAPRRARRARPRDRRRSARARAARARRQLARGPRERRTTRPACRRSRATTSCSPSSPSRAIASGGNRDAGAARDLGARLGERRVQRRRCRRASAAASAQRRRAGRARRRRPPRRASRRSGRGARATSTAPPAASTPSTRNGTSGRPGTSASPISRIAAPPSTRGEPRAARRRSSPSARSPVDATRVTSMPDADRDEQRRNLRDEARADREQRVRLHRLAGRHARAADADHEAADQVDDDDHDRRDRVALDEPHRAVHRAVELRLALEVRRAACARSRHRSRRVRSSASIAICLPGIASSANRADDLGDALGTARHDDQLHDRDHREHDEPDDEAAGDDRRAERAHDAAGIRIGEDRAASSRPRARRETASSRRAASGTTRTPSGRGVNSDAISSATAIADVERQQPVEQRPRHRHDQHHDDRDHQRGDRQLRSPDASSPRPPRSPTGRARSHRRRRCPSGRRGGAPATSESGCGSCAARCRAPSAGSLSRVAQVLERRLHELLLRLLDPAERGHAVHAIDRADLVDVEPVDVVIAQQRLLARAELRRAPRRTPP